MSPELLTDDDLFANLGGFDINAAFHDAMTGVANDAELALTEKVRRMETIVKEGTSEVYRDLVDLRSMAAQMEFFCSHDQAFNELAGASETLTGFMQAHADHEHPEEDDDEYEIDPKTGKKRKKKKRFMDRLLAKVG